MANERTIVSLSEDARKAVAARMRQRGETASTYFSGGQVTMTEKKESGGVSSVDNGGASVQKSNAVKAEAALRIGREQVGVTELLFTTPASAAARRRVSSASQSFSEGDETIKLARTQARQRNAEAWLAGRPSQVYLPSIEDPGYVPHIDEDVFSLRSFRQARALMAHKNIDARARRAMFPSVFNREPTELSARSVQQQQLHDNIARETSIDAIRRRSPVIGDPMAR